MIMSQRQKKILDLLEKGSLSIHQIAAILFLSEMTVRRELEDLEKSGRINRCRGAVSLNRTEKNLALDLRQNSAKSQKCILAQKAASFIRDGQLIFIDSSSTCLNIIPHLSKYKNLCIVTNSLKALSLLEKEKMRVKLVCGDVDFRDLCLVGTETVRYLQTFHFDIAFLSAQGIDDLKITDDNEAQTLVRRCVIENSKQSVCLLDSSKIGKTFPYTVCRIEQITVVKTEDC